MESEFSALDKAGEEGKWLQNFLEDIPYCPKPVAPICIHCDIQAAIGRAGSMMYNGKSCHIRWRHNIVRKLLSSGIITVDYVKSKDNVSNPLTKGLSREGIKRTSKGMGLRPRTIPISQSNFQIQKPYDVPVNQRCHIEATTEEHNITVDNPSTAFKEEEKVEPFNLGERKNYPFEGFNISDEALKKLTQLINDYSEWIANRLLKHHAGRYCQQQSKVFRNEECLINIIKDFSISTGLPWYLVDEVYIPIHWVLAVIVLKERHIRVYNSMLQRRYFGSSSEIQKLIKILPTYLDMSGFLDQKVCTDWSTIEAYWDKMANPFDVQYVEGIAQQTIGSLDCGPFVAAYAEYLSDGLQVPNDGLDAGLLQKRYAALLGKYGEVKAQKPYATDVKDP
ncbi:hypothetical protein T459_29977 [Capsicum annuum]|uniref:Ubiquitin-like protease family profile domain-containing protein n=1 Tax=Capsicum annuum TaxID=4072 RepID=A0A2G2Y754_CAPAN|nr:hypothetical protein T459_29977 [Capsicum annuum]